MMTVINPRGRASNPPIGPTSPTMTSNSMGTYSIATNVTNSAEQPPSQTREMRSGSFVVHGQAISMGNPKPAVSGGRMFPR
jgi:hypothetical protein